MKKGTVRSIAVLAILLIIYLLIVFVIPFERGPVFWVSFVFTLLAFLLSSAAAYIGFVKQPDAKSKFYGFPILKIAAVYLAAQTAVGLLFSLVSYWWIPVWIPVLVYGVGLAAAAIGLISADSVVEEIHAQDQKLKKNVTLMRGLQSKVNQMKNQCEDPAAAKAVAEFADALRYSDSVSSDALRKAEADLSAAVDELQSAVVEGDNEAVLQLCRKATGLLNERNRLCRLNK